MRRESIFALIKRYERNKIKLETRHAQHVAKGKPCPTTCCLCRIDAARALWATKSEEKP